MLFVYLVLMCLVSHFEMIYSTQNVIYFVKTISICDYLIDFQRNNFLENVFNCLFFNQKRAKTEKCGRFLRCLVSVSKFLLLLSKRNEARFLGGCTKLSGG